MVASIRAVVLLAIAVKSVIGLGDDIPANVLTQFEPEIGFLEGIELVEDSLLLSKQSEYQKIEVHKSRFYGNILVLDNVLQITERDGDSYNEMMAHIPMFLHPKPKRVLIIGGGDGYVLSEVLKHESVQVVDHVDLDGEVINVCKKFFGWGKAWEDPRVNLHITDGAKFVRDTDENYYDVIIQDSSDPWIVDDEGNMTPLPSGVLFEESHFHDLHRILSPNGVLNIQVSSIFFVFGRIGIDLIS
jgi:spermidine synthase